MMEKKQNFTHEKMWKQRKKAQTVPQNLKVMMNYPK